MKVLIETLYMLYVLVLPSTKSASTVVQNSAQTAAETLGNIDNPSNPHWLNVKRATGSKPIGVESDIKHKRAPSRGQQFPQFPVNQREVLKN